MQANVLDGSNDVELRADPRHLALADPGAAHRNHHIIDAAGADAQEVGLQTTACSATSMRRRGGAAPGRTTRSGP